MKHPSDTPPHGDFARYVEQLTASNAATVAKGREDMLQPPQSAPAAGMSPALGTLPEVAATSVVTHIKWLVALWIGTQLLGSFVSWAGFLFVPALFAYIAWAVYKSNQQSSGALLVRLRALAARAAEEAAKASSTSSSKTRK
jgi:cytosine/uracil/thiamine/allantoin permease